jgi:uncharacterized DUF497 family protein
VRDWQSIVVNLFVIGLLIIIILFGQAVTDREDKIWIISARELTKVERKEYEETI